MNLIEWFDKGLTPKEYMNRLEDHHDHFLNIYNHFSVPNEAAILSKIKEKNLRVIAIAEVWCGHCMLCAPILLRLAEQTGMSVKFLPRDENLELMDQYLTNDKRIIPIFVFIDEDGNEVANWGPMAETTTKLVDELKKDVPAKDAEDYHEKFKAFAKRASKEFSENESIWNGTYESIVKSIS